MENNQMWVNGKTKKKKGMERKKSYRQYYKFSYWSLRSTEVIWNLD